MNLHWRFFEEFFTCMIHKLGRSFSSVLRKNFFQVDRKLRFVTPKSTDFNRPIMITRLHAALPVDYNVPTTVHKQILKLFISGPDIWLWTLNVQHCLYRTNGVSRTSFVFSFYSFKEVLSLQLPTSFSWASPSALGRKSVLKGRAKHWKSKSFKLRVFISISSEPLTIRW